MNLKRLVFGSAVGAFLLLGGHALATSNDDDPVYSQALADMNDRLRATGVTNIAISKAELIVQATRDGDHATTILANDRTHLFPEQFVENDPRRGGSGDISYLIDQSDGAALSFNSTGTAIIALSNAVTEPELDASVAAWTQLKCNGPGFVKVRDSGADPDLIDGILPNPDISGLIGTPFADITFAGWLPAGFFNLLLPNGSAFILGVTFTFIFVEDDGITPTDLDRNGRADVAFREISFQPRIPVGYTLGPHSTSTSSPPRFTSSDTAWAWHTSASCSSRKTACSISPRKPS